jgi:hypothetical protein
MSQDQKTELPPHFCSLTGLPSARTDGVDKAFNENWTCPSEISVKPGISIDAVSTNAQG